MHPTRVLPRLLAASLACAAVTVVGASASAAPVDPTPQTLTFNHTGAAQSWTVPDDVVEATFDLYGGQGAGEGKGGLGGRVTATLPVTPGSVVTVVVGGAGGHPVGTRSLGSTAVATAGTPVAAPPTYASAAPTSATVSWSPAVVAPHAPMIGAATAARRVRTATPTCVAAPSVVARPTTPVA